MMSPFWTSALALWCKEVYVRFISRKFVPCNKHRTHISSLFLHFWCSTPKNPPRTDFPIVLLFCSDSMCRTNANPHLHCNFSYKVINCCNHYGHYDTMWLLGPWRIFKIYTPFLNFQTHSKIGCYSHMMPRIWPKFSYRFPLL